MKNTRFYSLLLGFSVLMLVFSACKDQCKDVTCVNGACLDGNCLCNDGWTGANCDQRDACYQRSCINGYCADGSCVCDLNYEGNTCSTPINQKFVGSWYVLDTSLIYNYRAFYSISIQPLGTTLNAITIQNLYDDNRTVQATLAPDRYTFSIPLQLIAQYSFGSSFEAQSTSASMSATDGSITIAYDIYDSASDTLYDRCIARCLKF